MDRSPASTTDERQVPSEIRRILDARVPMPKAGDALVRASVLLPLFALEPGGDAWIWLVRRADMLRTHQGQVALPGGKWDEGDPDLVHTALRESYEEIGLPPEEVEILGTLDDLVTITGYVVTPHVGWIERPFTPEPHVIEVARVFASPLATFSREPVFRTISVSPAIERLVPVYEVEGETIWGATASILRSFTGLLAAAPR
jgi:8-oxo-dGTP pyrophosphatase MutT (NUDIX family)